MSGISNRRFFGSYGYVVCVVLLLHFANGVEFLTEKPSYIKTCKIYEPGFTKCSTESIQKLMNQLSIGIQGKTVSEKIGFTDPMNIDKIVFKQDNNEAATIRANITDLLATGFSKIVIKESKVSKKDFSWETKIFLPRLVLDGKYKMTGKILLLPLSGKGKIYIDLDKLDILMHTKTRLYEKGGFTFYNVTDLNVDISIKGLKVNLSNLFNGKSKEVEESTNQFFNDNWPDFYEALRPLISETVATIIKRIIGEAFHFIPANFFVEDIPTSEQLYGKKTL